MNAGHLAGDMFIFLTVAFAVYLSVVMIRRINAVVLKDSYRKAFYLELFICAVFLLCALDIRFSTFTWTGRGVLTVLGWIFRITVCILAVSVILLAGKITIKGFHTSDEHPGYAIVLGLALENGEPTEDLIKRIDTAEQYLKSAPGTVLVLTGGNPDDSGKTEAEVMRDILKERGVDAKHMILEDAAGSTRENFENVVQIIGGDEPVTVITSNYHMDRAVLTAKKAGFSRVSGCPAPSSLTYYPANVLWEVLMELNELTLGL